jgi:phage I-like protein
MMLLYQRLKDKRKALSQMEITKTNPELIERAWVDGREYERNNVLEILEHLKKGTSIETFDATLLLGSLITVLKEQTVRTKEMANYEN